jgi:hypothetical protein
MNIPVRTYSGGTVVRPDTTWERDDDPLFIPDTLRKVSFTPVVTVTLSRAGRSIGRRFASRYFELLGAGILLYPEDLIDGREEGFAEALCMDHTSFIRQPSLKAQEYAFAEIISASVDGEEAFSSEAPSLEMICGTISSVSERVYLRRGDILAIELSPRKTVIDRDKEGLHDTEISVRMGDRTMADFMIKV